MRTILLRIVSALFSFCVASLIGIGAILMFAMGAFLGGITQGGKSIFGLAGIQIVVKGAPLILFALIFLAHFIVMALWPRRKFSSSLLISLARSEVLAAVVAVVLCLFPEQPGELGVPLAMFGAILIQSILLWTLKRSLQASGEAFHDDDIRFDAKSAAMRFVRFFILWPASVVLALLLVLITINCFDEKLSPRAKELLAVPPNRLTADQNLFMARLGIDAPPGISPLDYAEAKIAKYERDLAEATPTNLPGTVTTIADSVPPGLALKGSTDFCKPLTSSVWYEMESHKAEIEQLLADNQLLYQRYLALHGLSGFYATTTASVYGADVAAPFRVRWIFLANFVLRMRSHDLMEQKKALADMKADIQTWRVMFSGYGGLVPQMVALAYIQADYLILGDMVSDKSINVSMFSTDLDRMMMPFGNEDWRLGKAFAYQYRSMEPMFQYLDSGRGIWKFSNDNWWTRSLNHFGTLFFKMHATENLGAATWSKIIEVADADPAEMDAAHDAFEVWKEKNVNVGAHYVYNFLGKLNLSIAAADDHAYQYMLDRYDVAAVQRLAKLGYEIRKQHIAPKDIPEFIRKHPEWASHPVDGQAFIWSREKGEIAVKPLGNYPNQRRFSIVVWRSAEE